MPGPQPETVRRALTPLAAGLALALLAMPALGADPKSTRLATVLTLTDATSVSEPGDLFYRHAGDDTHGITGLSLRLQLTGAPREGLGYRVDYLNVKQDGVPAPATTEPLGAARFRAQSLRWDLEQPRTSPAHPVSTQTVRWYHELDQSHLRLDTGPVRTTLGRQPITWGVGRFWQPTDVFVAFAPTELERDFKPGIDALLLEAFTGDFSSVSMAYVLSRQGAPRLDNSLVARLRSRVGRESEVALLAGSVQGADMLGGSVETVWLDAGWRLEALAYRLPAREAGDTALFAIAGVDVRFSGGYTLIAEWYRHSAGATTEAGLPAAAVAPDVARGRRPQLSHDLLALSVHTEFGGLWTGSYSVFGGVLQDAAGDLQLSSLHQAALTYSISDNANAVFSLLRGTGRGLDAAGRIRSEFGHVPTTLTVQVQITF